MNDQTEASSVNQFVELYKDESMQTLLGWLNTYANGNPASVVEQWSIKSKEDINLYGASYCVKPIFKNVPENYNEWLTQVKAGPDFEAYINRVSICFDYASFQKNDNRELVAQQGIRAFGIYNGKTKGSLENIVQLTLKANPVQPDGENQLFEQLSLMTTLEATDPWFTFTDEILLDTPLSFIDFIENGGIKEVKNLMIPKKEIAIINSERVYASPQSPLVNANI